MLIKIFPTTLILILQISLLYGQQNNLFLDIIERTNTILFHLNETIEDTQKFLPSYDFIIVGSGSGGISVLYLNLIHNLRTVLTSIHFKRISVIIKPPLNFKSIINTWLL